MSVSNRLARGGVLLCGGAQGLVNACFAFLPQALRTLLAQAREFGEALGLLTPQLRFPLRFEGIQALARLLSFALAWRTGS